MRRRLLSRVPYSALLAVIIIIKKMKFSASNFGKWAVSAFIANAFLLFFCTKRLKADYPAPLNPYCGKNDAYGYSGVKNYGHFQPCTSAVKAKDILYYNKPPANRGPLLSEWANCSALIPPDTLVLPAVQINGRRFFFQTAVSQGLCKNELATIPME